MDCFEAQMQNSYKAQAWANVMTRSWFDSPLGMLKNGLECAVSILPEEKGEYILVFRRPHGLNDLHGVAQC